jgi:hypothetical protein
LKAADRKQPAVVVLSQWPWEGGLEPARGFSLALRFGDQLVAGTFILFHSGSFCLHLTPKISISAIRFKG